MLKIIQAITTEQHFSPLRHLLGDFAQEYMFMMAYQTETEEGEIELVYAYKHNATRQYVYLNRYAELVKPIRERDTVRLMGFGFMPKSESSQLLIENALAYYKHGEMLKRIRESQRRSKHACFVSDFNKHLVREVKK